MAIKGYKCKQKCSECKKDCSLDQQIPCSPDCENLTEDGKIKIRGCLESGCDEVKYIFDMENCTVQEIMDIYGEITNYPYDIT